MTDIQWICIWSDVGYQPGGHHVPYPRSMPIGLELWQVGSSDPDIVIDPVLRTTLAQITTMDLPVEYKDIRTATYIAVLISGTSDFIYGWIRSIEEIAGRSPACRIEWEVDNWRTYFGMELRRGCTLLRYPVSGSGLAMNTDIVNIRQGEYRTAEVLGSLTDYLNVNSTYIPTALKDAWLHLNWAVIRYVTPGSRTKITTVTWPVQTDITVPTIPNIYVSATMPPVTATTKQIMKMSDIYQGLVDEMITVGSDPLDPDNIITACITPMCPFGNDFRISTNGGNTIVTPVNTGGAWQFKTGGAGDIYGYFEDSTSASITDMHAMTGVFPPQLGWLTDLETTAVITDMDGNIAYTQPWSGLTWPYYSIGWDFSPGSASMIVQMHHDAAHQSVGHAFASDVMEGSVAVIPLPSIPITSNSWSAYVSSGTREYEIRAAEMEAENAMWKGLANTGTSAMNGAVAGAITGSGAGAAAGAVVGAIFNVAGTLIGAELDAQMRPKVQALKDTAVQNQAQKILLPGGSPNFFMGGQGTPTFSLLRAQGGNWANDQAENGRITECPMITPLVLRPGPWQISGAVPDGEMPVSARLDISRMLAQGVYIDSITEEEELP